MPESQSASDAGSDTDTDESAVHIGIPTGRRKLASGCETDSRTFQNQNHIIMLNAARGACAAGDAHNSLAKHCGDGATAVFFWGRLDARQPGNATATHIMCCFKMRDL